jgi:hypothetical protein
METKELKSELTDAQLAIEMLRRKVATEGQLKAAIDYQESVGGRLMDILPKLGLVRASTLEQFLKQLSGSQEGGDGQTTGPQAAAVDPLRLKVHRKLLEKVPQALQASHEILLFFPPPGTRAILMSCEPAAPAAVVEQLQALLGVEIRAIQLAPEVRKGFREPAESAAQRPRGSQASRQAPARSESGPLFSEEQEMLRALLNVLVKKQLISAEELKVEIELLRRRPKA